LNKELQVENISQFAMSWLRKKKHLNVDVEKRGSIFTKCTICESLKDLISKVGKNNPDVKKYKIKLKKHNIHQESRQCLYHTWKVGFVQSKEDFLCVIHDKMDLSKNIFALASSEEQNDVQVGVYKHLVYPLSI